jgi:flagellar basal body-associated protein FliL
MAFSEQNLDDYIQKVIEIQQQQESQALSNEQLKQIAANMGLTEMDLRRAQDGYLQRGNGFLQHNNSEDAIREFQQAILLQPHNENALFGLAKSYQQLWLKTGKNTYKEQAEDFAQKCLQINPTHQASFRLISELKNLNKNNSNRNVTTNPAQTSQVVSMLVLGVFLLFAGAATLFLVFSSESKPERNAIAEKFKEKIMQEALSDMQGTFHTIYAATGSKGAVVWLISYNQKTAESKGFLRDYFLQIIDLVSGNTLKTITLAEEVDFMTQVRFKLYGDKFYTFNDKTAQLEGRDVYTGEVVENNETLSKTYPELSKGIGKLQNSSGWFEIITKDGQKFWYAPSIKLLASDAQKSASVNKRDDWVEVLDVFFTDDDANSKVYIVKRLMSSFYTNYDGYYTSQKLKEEDILSRLERTQRFGNQLVGKITDRTFINAKLVYSSKDYILILHENEISPQAQKLLTCITPEGKILWHSQNIESKLIQNSENFNSGAFNVNRFGEQLCLSWPYVKVENKSYPFGLMINLSNGKMVEYSPTYVSN